jgi:hypothetical protein
MCLCDLVGPLLALTLLGFIFMCPQQHSGSSLSMGHLGSMDGGVSGSGMSIVILHVTLWC